MPEPSARTPGSYGQSFSSDSEDRLALPKNVPPTYGQSFSSVRGGPAPARRPAPPNNTPLLPRGLKQPRRSSPRLESFDYTGPYAYSITINAEGGRPHFRDARFVRFCIGTLHERAAVHAFEVLAYCFMPNHAHLLVLGLTECSRLRTFMQQFKQVTGFACKQERGITLWHRSYHDHVVRKEEDIHAIANYIWGNPVRGGLVESAEDYPYSGPVERLLGEAGRVGDEAASGGQTLRSVRTDTDPLAEQA